MYQLKDLLQAAGVMVTGVVLYLCQGVAVYAADDYLTVLEAEADETGMVGELVPPKIAGQEKKARHAPASKVIESGLSFDEFEEVLKTRYSGSNFLFIKLSRDQRKDVYSVYQNDNRISSVREEIVRLLSSG